jgi:putative glutathione S-transferase
MVPAAPLVRTARLLWHSQWEVLMGGLGPADAQGRYRRPAAAFCEPPPLPAEAGEAGAHVLIVGRSCPWAHRAWLVWTLRQLGGSIELLVVEPDPAAGRWRFAEPFEGCTTLLDLYRRSGGDPSARATVPALYSRNQGRILVGESARLIELLNRWPAAAAAPDLAPDAHSAAIERWRDQLQDHVNDGVYRCGFARNQAAYDEAEGELFAALKAVEVHLREREGTADVSMIPAGEHPSTAATTTAEQSSGPWLCGSAPSLADVVLFPTLIRLELVYAPLFGCSRLPLRQLPALHRWRARFHRLPGVAATCFPEAWRRDYFGALFPLHPSGIIPAGPDLADLVAT